MSCTNCNNTSCTCSTKVLRYNGPDIPELGISTGDLIEVVIQNITNYITEAGSGAVSIFTDNSNGTYTHSDGAVNAVTTTFTTGRHTNGATAPSSPNYGDTWYDTNTSELKWFTNNGTIDIWYTVSVTASIGFKEETIHHSVGTVLAIDPALHNKREIHFESTGEMSLDGNAHQTDDDYTYLLVNTTAVNRSVTFTNVTGAFIRDGGTIADLAGAGFTVPTNTTMLVTVTNNGGNRYVNGHFYALEITGDPINLFDSTVSLVATTPLVVNVATMVNMESVQVLDSTGEDITSGILIAVSAANITLTSNVSLANIEIRVIYSI